MSELKDWDKMMEACYLCGQLCAPKGLKAHIRSHTNITIFDCSECNFRFSTKKLLQEHKITHATHYLCEECNGKYKDTKHLKSHKCIPVMEQRECKYCGKFCAPKGLVPHIRSHKNCKKYGCDECEDKFSSKKNLKKHKSAHKVYLQCDDCNGKFKDAERLKTHTCIYGKEKNHFCDSCGKAFFTRYDLNRHQIIHTNSRPFKCDICKKGFNQKSNRDSHYRTHNQSNEEIIREKKFVCEICFHAFGYKQHLKRHLLIHNNEKPYSCETCKKCFSQKSYLKLHALVHTNEKPFECDKCHRRFPCKWKLVQHQRRHEEPVIFCSYCSKGFYMPSEYDRHLLSHTKAKPYICDICHKGFTARYSLQAHYHCHINRVKRKNKRNYEIVQTSHGGIEGGKHDDVSENEIYNVRQIENETVDGEIGNEVLEDEISNETFEGEIDNETFESELNYEAVGEEINYEVIEINKDDINQGNSIINSVDDSNDANDDIVSFNYENYSDNFNDQDDSEYVEIEIPTHLIENENFFADSDNFVIQENTFEEPHMLGALIIKLKKELPCPVCKKLFSDEIALENHKKEFIQEKDFMCCKCGKKCDVQEDLLSHQKIHQICLKDPLISFIKSEYN